MDLSISYITTHLRDEMVEFSTYIQTLDELSFQKKVNYPLLAYHCPSAKLWNLSTTDSMSCIYIIGF